MTSKKTATAKKPGKRVAKPASKPKALTTAQRLDAVGIDTICRRIESGEDDGTIASSLGMDRMSLRQWIKGREHEDVIKSAREESAEAWLDDGLNTIRSSLSKDNGIDSGAARAYAQECARRAAIRNPRYRDKQTIDLSAEVVTMTDEQRRTRLAELTAKLANK